VRDRDENEWLERVRGDYQSAGPTGAVGGRERLLERISRERPPRRHMANPFGWLSEQPVSVQGAVVCAALLLAAASGVGALRGLERAPEHEAASVTASRTTESGAPAGLTAPRAIESGSATGGAITFAYRAPQVSSVSLVGDFNSWDPRATPMRRQGQGDVWTAQVALPEGLHSYAYVIDGEQWQPDPGAPLSADTPFGRRSSIIVVGERETF